MSTVTTDPRSVVDTIFVPCDAIIVKEYVVKYQLDVFSLVRFLVDGALDLLVAQGVGSSREDILTKLLEEGHDKLVPF